MTSNLPAGKSIEDRIDSKIGENVEKMFEKSSTQESVKREVDKTLSDKVHQIFEKINSSEFQIFTMTWTAV